MKINVRLIYLYLFSFVGLLVVVVGSVRIVDLGLKVFVFKNADRYDTYPVYPAMVDGRPVDMAAEKTRADTESTRQRQRDLSNSLAMIAVGLPLYVYHWKTIQKENKK